MNHIKAQRRADGAARGGITRLVAGLSAGALLLTACGGGDSEEPAADDGSEAATEEATGEGTEAAGPSGEPLTIGIVDGLTGSTAFGGQADVCGATIAKEVVNDEGGILGRPVELDVHDDEATPAVAAQAASELAGAGVQFVVGGAISSTLLAAIPIYNDAGILHTGGTSKAPDVTESGDLVVRLNSNTIQDAQSIAELVSATAESVAFVAQEGAYGESAVAGLVEQLDEGVEVTDQIFVAPDTTDFASVMTTINSSKPDAIVFALFGNEQPAGLMRAFQQSGSEAQLIAGAGVLTDSLVDAAGDAANGVVSAAIWTPFLDNEQNNKLSEAFETRAGDIPECSDKPFDAQVALTYSQVLLLKQAIEEVGEADPQAVFDAIAGGTYELPQGTTSFDEDGQLADPEFVYVRAENGQVTEAADVMG